jgi:hypothetical protein
VNPCWVLFSIAMKRDREQAKLRGVSFRDAGNLWMKFQLSTACSARPRKKCWFHFFWKSFMTRTKKRTTRAYVWLTPEDT